jgi:triacylglycerol lipase
MAQRTLILAHGILGFGRLPALSAVVNYFNGVARHLERQGHVVFAPQVSPIGGVVERGQQLAAAILKVPAPDEGLHVIAHSMGGLDARYALSFVDGVAARVKTLVTIGTPHRGSPVADAIEHRTDPLFARLPDFLVQALEDSGGGLHDLTTPVATARDAATPDVAGVRYIELAGDASQGGHELLLFQVAAAIGELRGEVNDGVVTRASALRNGTEHLDDWPVDHAGVIGWSLATPVPIEFEVPLLSPPPHFARYDAIVTML